jgi:hypothetical protein
MACRSHANARRFAAPGAIPTVEFILHDPGAVVKKVGVKSYDWAAVTERVASRQNHAPRHARESGHPVLRFAAVRAGAADACVYWIARFRGQ